ncbi:putative protein YhaZ [BD1-7 clade bacterium]|uniref:DNA alkylation repair enzyme n=1 Tax=BD1-7 clade bacterium TaxID=2029982 RepID=A0A5S9QDP1_9GAMM|nr:putative protein YhaZ [BD1-7 clade bacterium]CAA0116422.1 putative protein YhaZ [BD1-7 clade bacterium]
MALMKDKLAEREIGLIAGLLKQAWPAFNTDGFIRIAEDELDQRELKDRVRHIIAAMQYHLPDDFVETAEILQRLPALWPHSLDNEAASFSEFAGWPLVDFVAVAGIDQPDIALPLLGELTGLFSAEFAIRSFIAADWPLTLSFLQQWQQSDNHHQRRLVSEGTRPRLPWGERLPVFIDDPTPVLGLLESMVDDSSETVRRSVANNLNDIGKDHPYRVTEFLKPFSDVHDSSTEKSIGKQRQRLVRHALRSLIKAGDTNALALIGVRADASVQLSGFNGSESVYLGDALAFDFQLESTAEEDQMLVIDFAIHFVKANGATSAKVFKLKTLELAAGKTLSVKKKHSLKPITTRVYYPGLHQLEIFINGKSYMQHAFDLVI